MRDKLSYKRMNAKTKTPDATKLALLEAALRCLHRGGMEGATSRAIAAEAGTNLQAIAYHFGSKDRLVSEALVTGIRRWLEPALDVLRRDMDPFRRMMLAVSELERAFDRAREDVPVYLQAMAEAPRNETVSAALNQLFDEIHGFVSKQIADLKRKKLVPKWVDPDAMATLQIAAVDGLAIHAVLHPKSVDHRTVAKQGSRLLVAARTRRST
jgi:AcrR family transcriptional regulator